MFNVSTDDYGDEIWFGGYGDGTITIEGAKTMWYGGGMKQDKDQWAAAIQEARLISAAPDMLAALEEMVRLMPLDAINVSAAIRAANKAIAKAKGESE